MTDHAALADLAAFAQVEVESRDVEPWADLLAALWVDLGPEDVLWLIKLYNAYDDLGSAWNVYRRWPSPAAWYVAADRHEAADYPCTNERRNLRAGKVLRHLDAYAGRVGGSQQAWLDSLIVSDDPLLNWTVLKVRLRAIWGVGRQTSYEWAEFLGKVADYPVAAPDADLWESEGPRRSLQRLYGNSVPTRRWLDARADECRTWLAQQGTPLAWEDFETIICDFNVMRDGRYYPGKHLAALKAEIQSLELLEDRRLLTDAFASFVPDPWLWIEPGVVKERQTIYRDTGVVLTAP